jgi:hypothetical protein
LASAALARSVALPAAAAAATVDSSTAGGLPTLPLYTPAINSKKGIITAHSTTYTDAMCDCLQQHISKEM